MGLKFLTEPALLVEDALIVTDIHIGIEYEILHSGITIPSQVERIEKRLDNLIKQAKAKQLIILGDLKHQVPNISWQEYKETPKFFEHFKNLKIS
ncbi:MAG: hypothetical protein QXD55_00695, partial [Candidatus Aenigmatarchaeota archaeon]